MASGSVCQVRAPKAAAASRALSSRRVTTASSVMPSSAWIAGTWETCAQPVRALAPMIPTRNGVGDMGISWWC